MKDSIKCPLCEEQAHHQVIGNDQTHVWKCEWCPFVGLEFVNERDAYYFYNDLTAKA
jgi:ribosomal protein L37AE/L43A